MSAALLGTGTFGRVQREERRGVPVAVKYAEDVGHESHILRAAGSHPHIVSLYASEPGAIVLELGGTTLHTVLLSDGYDKTDKPLAWIIFRRVLDALTYLHSRNIVHRDMKAENVVMRSACDPMVIDFGLAHRFAKDERMLSSKVGSPHYAAPEVFHNRGSYDAYLADVWSIGVLFFMLLVQRYPLHCANATDPAFVYARAHQRIGVRPVVSYFEYYKQNVNEVLETQECNALNLMLDIDTRPDVFILCDHLGYSSTS